MDKIAINMQTPKDANGNRKDIHFVNTSDEVICYPHSDNPEFLSDVLERVGTIQISDTQPSHACLWGKPVNVDD